MRECITPIISLGIIMICFSILIKSLIGLGLIGGIIGTIVIIK